MIYIEPYSFVVRRGDYDNDGTSDAQDTCAFAKPSGIDANGDGIDDVCQISDIINDHEIHRLIQRRTNLGRSSSAGFTDKK